MRRPHEALTQAADLARQRPGRAALFGQLFQRYPPQWRPRALTQRWARAAARVWRAAPRTALSLLPCSRRWRAPPRRAWRTALARCAPTVRTQRRGRGRSGSGGTTARAAALHARRMRTPIKRALR
jgi:hypothetical protein